MVLDTLPKPNNDNRVAAWPDKAQAIVQRLAKGHAWTFTQTDVPSEFGDDGHSGGICFCISDKASQIMAITKWDDFAETTVSLKKKCEDERFIEMNLTELANKTKTALVIHRSF